MKSRTHARTEPRKHEWNRHPSPPRPKKPPPFFFLWTKYTLAHRMVNIHDAATATSGEIAAKEHASKGSASQLCFPAVAGDHAQACARGAFWNQWGRCTKPPPSTRHASRAPPLSRKESCTLCRRTLFSRRGRKLEAGLSSRRAQAAPPRYTHRLLARRLSPLGALLPKLQTLNLIDYRPAGSLHLSPFFLFFSCGCRVVHLPVMPTTHVFPLISRSDHACCRPPIINCPAAVKCRHGPGCRISVLNSGAQGMRTCQQLRHSLRRCGLHLVITGPIQCPGRSPFPTPSHPSPDAPHDDLGRPILA